MIGTANVRLDCRFSEIRTKETNVANWVADIMADGTSSDVALLNSGTLRADTLMDTGAFKMADLVALLPRQWQRGGAVSRQAPHRCSGDGDTR